MVKHLSGAGYSKSWDDTLPFIPLSAPPTLAPPELAHTEKYFPWCWNVLLLDMYLWLVLIDHFIQWTWDWLFPWSLPTWFVSCTAYSDPLKRDEEPDFYFLLVLLQQGSSFMSQQPCSRALVKLCALWSLERNLKFRATVCVNRNVQSTFLEQLKSHCIDFTLKNVFSR